MNKNLNITSKSIIGICACMAAYSIYETCKQPDGCKILISTVVGIGAGAGTLWFLTK